MTKIISLQEVMKLRGKVEKEIEFYQDRLKQSDLRLSIIQEERRQLIELLDILEKEKERGYDH